MAERKLKDQAKTRGKHTDPMAPKAGFKILGKKGGKRADKAVLASDYHKRQSEYAERKAAPRKAQQKTKIKFDVEDPYPILPLRGSEQLTQELERRKNQAKEQQAEKKTDEEQKSASSGDVEAIVASFKKKQARKYKKNVKLQAKETELFALQQAGVAATSAQRKAARAHLKTLINDIQTIQEELGIEKPQAVGFYPVLRQRKIFPMSKVKPAAHETSMMAMEGSMKLEYEGAKKRIADQIFSGGDYVMGKFAIIEQKTSIKDLDLEFANQIMMRRGKFGSMLPPYVAKTRTMSLEQVEQRNIKEYLALLKQTDAARRKFLATRDSYAGRRVVPHGGGFALAPVEEYMQLIHLSEEEKGDDLTFMRLAILSGSMKSRLEWQHYSSKMYSVGDTIELLSAENVILYKGCYWEKKNKAGTVKQVLSSGQVVLATSDDQEIEVSIGKRFSYAEGKIVEISAGRLTVELQGASLDTDAVIEEQTVAIPIASKKIKKVVAVKIGEAEQKQDKPVRVENAQSIEKDGKVITVGPLYEYSASTRRLVIPYQNNIYEGNMVSFQLKGKQIKGIVTAVNHMHLTIVSYKLSDDKLVQARKYVIPVIYSSLVKLDQSPSDVFSNPEFAKQIMPTAQDLLRCKLDNGNPLVERIRELVRNRYKQVLKTLLRPLHLSQRKEVKKQEPLSHQEEKKADKAFSEIADNFQDLKWTSEQVRSWKKQVALWNSISVSEVQDPFIASNFERKVYRKLDKLRPEIEKEAKTLFEAQKSFDAAAETRKMLRSEPWNRIIQGNDIAAIKLLADDCRKPMEAFVLAGLEKDRIARGNTVIRGAELLITLSKLFAEYWTLYASPKTADVIYREVYDREEYKVRRKYAGKPEDYQEPVKAPREAPVYEQSADYQQEIVRLSAETPLEAYKRELLVIERDLENLADYEKDPVALALAKTRRDELKSKIVEVSKYSTLKDNLKQLKRRIAELHALNDQIKVAPLVEEAGEIEAELASMDHEIEKPSYDLDAEIRKLDSSSAALSSTINDYLGNILRPLIFLDEENHIGRNADHFRARVVSGELAVRSLASFSIDTFLPEVVLGMTGRKKDAINEHVMRIIDAEMLFQSYTILNQITRAADLTMRSAGIAVHPTVYSLSIEDPTKVVAGLEASLVKSVKDRCARPDLALADTVIVMSKKGKFTCHSHSEIIELSDAGKPNPLTGEPFDKDLVARIKLFRKNIVARRAAGEKPKPRKP
jgi:hypothetical protein